MFNLNRPLLAAIGGVLALAGAAGAAEGGGDTDIFNADIGNFIFTLIVFICVIGVLGRFGWKPLLTVLNERERTIRESLEAARAERARAEQLLADYQAQLDRARQEATALVDEGRRDAAVVRQRIQEETKREATEMLERARREIKLATDTAVKEIYDQTAELAVQVAGRIIQKELSAGDHQELVTESLERMEQTGLN